MFHVCIHICHVKIHVCSMYIYICILVLILISVCRRPGNSQPWSWQHADQCVWRHLQAKTLRFRKIGRGMSIKHNSYIRECLVAWNWQSVWFFALFPAQISKLRVRRWQHKIQRSRYPTQAPFLYVAFSLPVLLLFLLLSCLLVLAHDALVASV